MSGGFPSMNRAGPAVGGWVELARTTLGSASETLEVTGFADKRYLMFLIDGRSVSSEFQTVLQTGNSSFDTGSNYAIRSSDNGGADATGTSYPYTRISPSTSLSELFCVGYIANYASKEKLGQLWGMKRETAGAGTAPQRIENVWKWANTSNVIDRLRVNENGSGTINTNSEMVVLGWDPADTHTTNFWEELASVDSTTVSESITAKKYLWIQIWADDSSSMALDLTFNSDTGNNYAIRGSNNGAADGTGTSAPSIIDNYGFGGHPHFINMFVINNTSNEKLMIGHSISQSTAGAASAPNRRELVGKWANTSNQITSIQCDNAGTAFDRIIMKVWGAD